MLNKKLYSIFCDEGDLGNKLHSHYVYKLDNKSQIKAKQKIDYIIANLSEKEIMTLAFNKETSELITRLIKLKHEHNFKRVIIRYLSGLSKILSREIERSEPSKKMIRSSIKDIKQELETLPIYKENDIIKITKDSISCIKTNYINLSLSPNFSQEKNCENDVIELWRDTQFIFELNFDKNLFVWYYLNIAKPHRGKGIGTECVLKIEDIARKMGFRRFSVSYPNKNYWTKKLKYKIPYDYRIGTGKFSYVLEGYKEI